MFITKRVRGIITDSERAICAAAAQMRPWQSLAWPLCRSTACEIEIKQPLMAMQGQTQIASPFGKPIASLESPFVRLRVEELSWGLLGFVESCGLVVLLTVSTSAKNPNQENCLQKASFGIHLHLSFSLNSLKGVRLVVQGILLGLLRGIIGV